MGDLLLEMGLLDEPTLQAAMAEQRTSGRRLPRILGEKRVLDEERLTKAVAAKLGLEVVNVSSLKIHERVLALIPAPIAIRYGVLPIAIKRANGAEYLYLVMADPLDTEAIGEVQRVTGRQVRVLMAGATDLDAAIDTQYRAIQGKHVTPMPPATPPPPPVAPPAISASTQPAKPPSLQAVRKSELPAAALPPRAAQAPTGERRAGSLSTAARPADPTTGGPTELLRPSQVLRPYQPSAPTPPPKGTQTTPVRAATQPAAATAAKVPSVVGRPPAAPAPVAVQPATKDQPRRASKAEPAPLGAFRLTAQDLIHPMPLDAPEDEPKTRIDEPQEDWDLAVRDWSPPNALSQRVGEHQVRTDEPVTTEAKVSQTDPDHDPDHDEPFELIEIEAEEVSTSQIELEELSEAQVIAMQAQPVHLVAPSPIELMRAFEIPVEVEDGNHPFEGLHLEEVHAGLERTGIIPAIDWGSDQFEPPPLPDTAKPNRALIGGDIPMSKAAVEARLSVPNAPAPASEPRTFDTQEAPTLDFVAALELHQPPKAKTRKSDPPEKMNRAPAALAKSDDSDADRMPVIEPSSLMSLMDFESMPEDTGSDDIPEAPPSEVIETATVQMMIAPQIHVEDLEDPEPTPSHAVVDHHSVLSALDGQFEDPVVLEAPVELTEIESGAPNERARGMVQALLQGRSLKSAERAELLLALGRVLIKKGLIDEEELALELTLDADE
jgi:hypothetical protein